MKRIQPTRRRTKLLLLPPVADEELAYHPELHDWIERGWRVDKVRPRITDEGCRYFVVLSKKADAQRPSSPENLHRPMRRLNPLPAHTA